MKNRYTSFILSLFVMMVMSESVQSQFILGLSVNPPNPTTNDPVQIVAHVGFPSGDCIEKTLSFTTFQNSIQANALHCLGLATFICYDYDTFNLGTLNAGSYTFHFQLDAGQGMMPCTPGINPGPTDSISFDVNFPTAITEYSKQNWEIGPVPARGSFQITTSGNEVAHLTDVIVFQANGIPAKQFKSVSSNQPLDISTLCAGWYVVQIESQNGRRWHRKLLIY
jgi:hypothetical protein